MNYQDSCDFLAKNVIFGRMERYLDQQILQDVSSKMVLLTGPRQVGKTTLCQQLLKAYAVSQYLNRDVLAERTILQRQSWSPRAQKLVIDEIHKMQGWKAWLKGVFDGRTPGQKINRKST